MKTIILSWNFINFSLLRIFKILNPFFLNLSTKSVCFISAGFIFPALLVNLSTGFVNTDFSTKSNFNNSSVNSFNVSYLTSITKDNSTEVDTIEIEIKNLFLSKSVSIEQINTMIDQRFSGEMNKKAKESVNNDLNMGTYFVLTSDYPTIVKSFETILIKASKENNPINYRSKLQQVKHIEIYLDNLK